MATFRVGQRVKIVRAWAPCDKPRPEKIADPKGCYTGVLVRSLDSILNIFLNDGDWMMRLDNGIEGSVHSYMIEPIQPEGNQTVAWSECLWQPEHLREPA